MNDGSPPHLHVKGSFHSQSHSHLWWKLSFRPKRPLGPVCTPSNAKYKWRVYSLMLEREQCDCNKEMIANWALLSISSQHYTCNAWSRLKLEYSFWLQIGNENPWEFIDVEVIFLKLHLQVVLSEFKSVDVCALACVNSYWFLVMAYYILKA